MFTEFKRGLYQGAAYGLLAWIVYAIIEFVCISAPPLLARPNSVFTSWSWSVTLVLLSSYAIIGLVSGTLVGAIARPGYMPTGVALTLAVAAVVSALNTGRMELQEEIFLASGLVLAIGLLVTTRSKAALARWQVLRNPWVASSILLGPVIVANDLLGGQAVWVQVSGAVLALIIIAFAAQVLQRFVSVFWPHDGRLQITRRAVIVALSAVLAGIFTVALSHGFRTSLARARFGPPLTGRPNVVMVTLDTVQAGHLSLYGYHRNTTPHLRQLAREATLYTNAIAVSDMTLPTHASIFTGLYPREHGAHTDPPLRARPLAEGFQTLAEMLAAKGYTTLAVAGNRFYVQPEWGMAQGFQLFDSEAPVRIYNEDRRFFLREGLRKLLNFFISTWEYDLDIRRGRVLNHDIGTLLSKMKDERRSFFLFANYMDAHMPYLPPAPYDTMFPGKDPSLSFRACTRLERDIVTFKRKISQREQQHLIAEYDGAIAYLDEQMGWLIDQLKERGLYDNTLLIITSDHGEAFGKRNLISHPVSVYQNEIHVPLLIKYPNQHKGEVLQSWASQIDLLPTVLDVLGYQPPDGLYGRNLQNLDSRQPRQIISSSFQSALFFDVPRFHRTERAIFSGPMKFIHSTKGKRELYDLSKDPQETKNLYNPDDGAVAELQRNLDEWLRRVKPHASARTKIDPENLQRLKSLGYVQ